MMFASVLQRLSLENADGKPCEVHENIYCQPKSQLLVYCGVPSTIGLPMRL